MKNELFICARIKLLRNRRNFTQNYMAFQLGFENVRTYQRIENHQSNLTIEILYKICDVLKIKVADIIDPDLNLDHFITLELYNTPPPKKVNLN